MIYTEYLIISSVNIIMEYTAWDSAFWKRKKDAPLFVEISHCWMFFL